MASNGGPDGGTGNANRSNGAGSSRERLRQHARAMRDEGDALAHTTRAVIDDLATLSRQQLERNPYATLGVAFAAGYVLGGGLPARLVALAVGVSGRAAATMLARDFLEGIQDAPRSEAGARGDGPSERSDASGD